jgi:DNA polymerase (family X)
MHSVNKELARIFEEIGSIYEFLGSENKFRAIAYHNAARIISDLSEDVQKHVHEDKMDKLYGVGESIQAKIIEYIRTGRIKSYEELRKQIPEDFIKLLHVQGFGPETLKKLYTGLQIETRDEIEKALRDGRALQLKGFKQKKINNLLEALKLKNQSEERAILWEALEISETVINELRKIPGILKTEVAGSLRRGRETIGDIDILIAARDEDRKKIIRKFVETESISKVLAEGDTKASIFVENFRRQIDVRIVKEHEWGAALQYFTGSKSHNIHLRKIAIEKGLKINEYGIFEVQSGLKIAGKDEAEIYRTLDLDFIPAEMREDNGEIEAAAAGKIPALITLEDIKGDMHSHSRWSDGTGTLEEIATYALNTLKYEYLVITDHSQSEVIARGLTPERYEQQIEEIRRINRQVGKNILKAGAEVDILPDGSLDLPNDLLSRLDWVVASVHSRFNRDNTDRLIKACENPFVNVIGHPTGRQYGAREGYPVNMEKLIEVASATGTALEINAHSHRMDLDDHWARLAKDKGARLVISTDSHNFGNYAFMKLGIFIARRAWCGPEHILNTQNWNAIEKFRGQKQNILI